MVFSIHHSRSHKLELAWKMCLLVKVRQIQNGAECPSNGFISRRHRKTLTANTCCARLVSMHKTWKTLLTLQFVSTCFKFICLLVIFFFLIIYIRKRCLSFWLDYFTPLILYRLSCGKWNWRFPDLWLANMLSLSPPARCYQMYGDVKKKRKEDLA